jgi:hypothetical protein
MRTQISSPALLIALGFDSPAQHVRLGVSLDDEMFMDLLEQYGADPNQGDLDGLPLLFSCTDSVKFQALLRHPRIIVDGELDGVSFSQRILEEGEIDPEDALALLKKLRSRIDTTTLATYVKRAITWSHDSEVSPDAIMELFEFFPATLRSTMVRAGHFPFY